jgi:hypothetical protein
MIYGKQFIRATLENNIYPRIAVTVFVQDGEKFSAAKPLAFETVEPEGRCEHTFTLQRDAAQELMDELWRCGMRPSEGSGSAGAMAATERHLADMRVIAFDRLKITEKPGK